MNGLEINTSSTPAKESICIPQYDSLLESTSTFDVDYCKKNLSLFSENLTSIQIPECNISIQIQIE
jgi:hypothetical protein